MNKFNVYFICNRWEFSFSYLWHQELLDKRRRERREEKKKINNSLLLLSHMHMLFSLSISPFCSFFSSPSLVLRWNVWESEEQTTHSLNSLSTWIFNRFSSRDLFISLDILIICRRLKSSSLLQEQHIQVADSNSFASSTNNTENDEKRPIERERKKRKEKQLFLFFSHSITKISWFLSSWIYDWLKSEKNSLLRSKFKFFSRCSSLSISRSDKTIGNDYVNIRVFEQVTWRLHWIHSSFTFDHSGIRPRFHL